MRRLLCLAVLAGAAHTSLLAAHLQLSGLGFTALAAEPVTAGTPLMLRLHARAAPGRDRRGLRVDCDDAVALLSLDNGTGAAAGRFTAALNPGSGAGQALLQLFTAADPGARITGLYVQDGTGAVARDSISGGPLVRLSETQVHEVVLASPGANKIAVIKALSDDEFVKEHLHRWLA